jgi:hypothetical protein
MALDLEFRRAGREYATVFRKYAIDVDHRQPAEAVTRSSAVR